MSETGGCAAAIPVTLDGVTVTFGRGVGPKRALDSLSFRIAAGQVFCLLGPNGAGKTTTINLLLGLVRATSGDVRVFGEDPAHQQRAVLRRTAVVPQETALYEKLTGRENLEFHGKYYGVPNSQLPERITHALDVIALANRQNDRVETYSGGMRRRLAMGRTLITGADLILLDEPTVGVDVQSRNEIWRQVRTLADNGKAILLTTNYMDEAEALADEVLLIDHGKEVAYGTVAQLKATVGETQLSLAFSSPDQAAEAADRIKETRPDLAFERAGLSLFFAASGPPDALQTLNAAHQSLGPDPVGLESFAIREPSLQDVFLHYTGRAIRD